MKSYIKVGDVVSFNYDVNTMDGLQLSSNEDLDIVLL